MKHNNYINICPQTTVCYVELHVSTSPGLKLGFKNTKEEMYMFYVYKTQPKLLQLL
jgi:hypothetical protein